MYWPKNMALFVILSYHARQVKNAAAAAAAKHRKNLFLSKGLAIGALVNSGICLMGAHEDPVQRAIVGIAAMMGTLLDGTLNALICMAVHTLTSFYRFQQ